MGEAQPAIEAIYGHLGGDVSGLTADHEVNVQPEIDNLDGDAWLLTEDAGNELQAAATTPIGALVAQLPHGDAAHFAGDTAVAPVNAVQG